MSQRPMPHFPIVRHFDVEVSEQRRRAIESLAAGIGARTPRFRDLSVFGPKVRTGLSGGALLAIEDHSSIQLAKAQAIGEHFSYRILVLAGSGDLVAVGSRAFPAFERYTREVLKLGGPEVVAVPGAAGAIGLAQAAAQDPKLVDRAVALARKRGGLTLLPYMATGWIWRLASVIAERSDRPVEVAGPPPWLTEAANDKLWFAQAVEELLGPQARPASFAAYNMAAVIGFLRQLIREHPAVAVKMTASASSVGNLVLDARQLLGMNARELHLYLNDLLEVEQWPRDLPLQVVAWEAPLLASPSVQVWIPHRAEGPPIVEGLFDQNLAGVQGRFVGAAPSELPVGLQEAIAAEGAELALLLQHLGYFGRCSFDSILVGSDLSSAKVHWVECNGRWGGVSLPMSTANRIFGDWKEHPFVTVSASLPGRTEATVESFLKTFERDLLRPGSRDDGIVLLTPGTLEAGRSVDLMVCAQSAPKARKLASAVLDRVAGI